jgi:lipoprotein-anchoring transpeptidase ErfK/SrfK
LGRGLGFVQGYVLSRKPALVTRLFSHLAPLAAILLLAACGARPQIDATPSIVPGYEGVQDGAFFIQPVEPQYLPDDMRRTEIAYAGPESPGTIVVDTHSRRLYYVMEGGRAMRYAIAVGRQGLAFRGSGTIQRKEVWPAWTPTANMIRTFPDTYAQYRNGLPGGLENPLGTRALYLYRGGRDTYFRIHGTVQDASIGRATSAGCIRLFNRDAMDLFERVTLGTPVKVRSLEESIAIDGPYMDDAYGIAVPETPENIAKKEADLQTLAAAPPVEDDAAVVVPVAATNPFGTPPES